MAPEVLKGEMYNHKADVWSIGCLFYELLTGFMPFFGTSHTDLRNNLYKGTYKIPKTIQLSLEGVAFLNSLLKYNPVERLSWQQLCEHSYIQSEAYSSSMDKLMLSFVKDQHHCVMNNP